MVSVRSTVHPPEKLSLNDWFRYINQKPVNTIKKGGLWHAAEQNNFLDACKKLIGHEK